MALTSSLVPTGNKTGGPSSTQILAVTTSVNADAPVAGPTTQKFTAATFAAVAWPALTGSSVVKHVICIPPSANAGTITSKGVTGDTGQVKHKTEFWVESADSATASTFGLLCSADTVMTFEWY